MRTDRDRDKTSHGVSAIAELLVPTSHYYQPQLDVGLPGCYYFPCGLHAPPPLLFVTALDIQYRLTTCLENLEMSGNLTSVREMLGFY